MNDNDRRDTRRVIYTLDHLQKLIIKFWQCVKPSNSFQERICLDESNCFMLVLFLRYYVFFPIASTQDEPYLMYKDEETKKRAPRCGKENFKGFCADLAREVAAIVEFPYDICIVKDLKYGEKLPNETWNGMIGELTRDVSERMRIECYLSDLRNEPVWSVIFVQVLSLYTISRINNIVEIASAFIVCPIEIDICVCNNPVHPNTRFISRVLHCCNLF